jgi:hypothetical protein
LPCNPSVAQFLDELVFLNDFSSADIDDAAGSFHVFQL